MAINENVVVAQAKLDSFNGVFNFGTDTIKIGLTNSVLTPTEEMANPEWGAFGGTNVAANELTAGGNYIAGGEVSAHTWTLNGNVAELDLANVSWAVNASNPTDARWAYVYVDTAAKKQVLSYIDLGSIYDMTTGQLDINITLLFTLT